MYLSYGAWGTIFDVYMCVCVCVCVCSYTCMYTFHVCIICNNMYICILLYMYICIWGGGAIAFATICIYVYKCTCIYVSYSHFI